MPTHSPLLKATFDFAPYHHTPSSSKPSSSKLAVRDPSQCQPAGLLGCVHYTQPVSILHDDMCWQTRFTGAPALHLRASDALGFFAGATEQAMRCKSAHPPSPPSPRWTPAPAGLRAPLPLTPNQAPQQPPVQSPPPARRSGSAAPCAGAWRAALWQSWPPFGGPPPRVAPPWGAPPRAPQRPLGRTRRRRARRPAPGA